MKASYIRLRLVRPPCPQRVCGVLANANTHRDWNRDQGLGPCDSSASCARRSSYSRCEAVSASTADRALRVQNEEIPTWRMSDSSTSTNATGIIPR